MLTEEIVNATLAKLRAEQLVVNVSRREPLMLVGGWSERRADGVHFYVEGFTLSEKRRALRSSLFFANVADPTQGQLGHRIEDVPLDEALDFLCAHYRRRHPRPVFESFDLYVRAHPEGERFRDWITERGNRRVQDILLLPADPNQGCQLPGGYLWASFGWRPDPDRPEHHHWTVYIHDCDDGCVKKSVPDVQAAFAEYENLKLLAPFRLYELTEFGYKGD